MSTPKCKDCNAATFRVVSVGDGHQFLCASCEYKRYHPDAAPSVPMPHERSALPLQKETLFGSEVGRES